MLNTVCNFNSVVPYVRWGGLFDFRHSHNQSEVVQDDSRGEKKTAALYSNICALLGILNYISLG